MRLGGQRFFNAPTVCLNSGSNSIGLDLCYFSPLYKIFCFTIKCYQKSISAIFHLSGMICPSTVFGAVPFLIINPVNRISCWWDAHIFKERFKAIFPSFTNFYPSSSIIGKSLIFRLITPASHALPNLINFTTLVARCMPVRCSTFFCKLFIQTAARFGVAAIQVWLGYKSFIAAIAQAKPFFIRANSNQTNCGESLKACVRKNFFHSISLNH